MDTLESVRYTILTDSPNDALKIFDLFAMPNGSLKEATVAAVRRLNRQRENDMALLYFWMVGHFPLLHDDGKILMDKPTPLDAHDMRAVFQQISMHPAYKEFRVVGYSNSFEEIRLQRGTVE